MSKPRSIASMLSSQDRGVQRLIERVRDLQELHRRVRGYLPQSLAPHCSVANLRDGTLVLVTDSAAWHAKLRYLQPQLLTRLQREAGLRELRRIELRVAPPSQPPAPRRRRPLSRHAADLIRSSAAATEDPDLRQVLQRLARRCSD